MFAAFFRGLDEAAEAAVQASQTGVSALEHMDRFGVDLIEGLQTIPVPDGAGAVLLAETEENPGRLGRTLESLALSTSRIKGPDAEAVWKIRWTMLSRIRRVHEDGNHRFISFVDDLAVPAAQLPRFAREVCRIFDAEDLLTIIYGHIGEGNLHIRPLVARKDWQDTVARIGEKCFDACLELGGTLTAEHGPGRNRCPYIEKEWGTAADWFIKVKKLFDPEMLLNPGVLFECGSVTDHYAF
jgi:FAD/FMN-containing dehydrogenase